MKETPLWFRTLALLAVLGLADAALPAAHAADAAAQQPTAASQTAAAPSAPAAKTKQLIVWTSGDREVALKVVLMYAYNCKKLGWMDQVRLLVWGPSGRLLTEDEELQKELAGLEQVGVELYACKACADMYGISDKLSALGITVMYAGTMLADAQKGGDWHVLTF